MSKNFFCANATTYDPPRFARPPAPPIAPLAHDASRTTRIASPRSSSVRAPRRSSPPPRSPPSASHTPPLAACTPATVPPRPRLERPRTPRFLASSSRHHHHHHHPLHRHRHRHRHRVDASSHRSSSTRPPSTPPQPPRPRAFRPVSAPSRRSSPVVRRALAHRSQSHPTSRAIASWRHHRRFTRVCVFAPHSFPRPRHSFARDSVTRERAKARGRARVPTWCLARCRARAREDGRSREG